MAPLLRLFHNLLQQQLSASVYSFLVNNHAFQAFAVQSSRKAAELKDQVARSVEEAVKQAAAGRPSSSSSSSSSGGRKAGERPSEAEKILLGDGKTQVAPGEGFLSGLKKRFLS